MQRIVVQNIVIGSCTGIPACGSADSAMTHLAASRERDMNQACSSTSSPISTPETNVDTAVNQTPRASLANMPSNSDASTTFTVARILHLSLQRHFLVKLRSILHYHALCNNGRNLAWVSSDVEREQLALSKIARRLQLLGPILGPTRPCPIS